MNAGKGKGSEESGQPPKGYETLNSVPDSASPAYKNLRRVRDDVIELLKKTVKCAL